MTPGKRGPWEYSANFGYTTLAAQGGYLFTRF